MPASVVHMLISRIVRKRIEGTSAELHRMLTEHRSYMELGSLGPDLPYYEHWAQGVVKMYLDGSDKPTGVDQWSYQLHSREPNRFPLAMLEVLWRDADWRSPDSDWDEEDQRKFAFICGFLTHMAADQTIHPLVNDIAGPYYKRGENREKHRTAEVAQDVAFYNSAGRVQVSGLKSFATEQFNEWCDLNQGLGKNTQPWFVYFLQKAFVEAHATCPTEGSVEAWVDGVLVMLRGICHIGPYLKADAEWQETGGRSKRFDECYHDNAYEKHIEGAVELAAAYIAAAHRIFDGDNLDDDRRRKFRHVVQNADLSRPLERNILDRAKEALAAW